MAASPVCIVTTPSLPADDPAPEPPERPGDNQCCQSGCEPCIFDLYAEDMQAWRDDFRAWELRQASRKTAG